MKTIGASYRKPLAFLQAIFVYMWLANLSGTDSWFSVYLLCALGGLACLCGNYRRNAEITRGQAVWLAVFSAGFSLAVILANYPLFEPVTALLSLFNMGCCFVGGFSVGYQILLFLLTRFPMEGETGTRKHPGVVFALVFAATAAVQLMYLYFAAYPGVLTRDAVTTVEQIHSGVYNNVMPYWHTVTVEVFLDLGMAVFGEINRAVALVLSVQILFVSACFAYVGMTLYQAGVPGCVLALVCGGYVLLPYNIAYGATMWKDIPFAAAGLLFVTAFYRILRGLGKRSWTNYVVLVLGAVGFSLWRTNGWIAFLGTTVVMLFLLRRKRRKLLVLMCAVLVLCWVMINPLLDVLGVSGSDMIEALAVPFQQMARVVANDRELTEAETALLGEAFWLDRVKELYTPETVDPIKFEAFRHDNRSYVEENLPEYGKLYLKLGLRYPGDYLKAWVEETKGYWNGGYSYWIYTRGIDTNDLGLEWTGGDNLVSRLYGAWFRFLENPAVFQPLYSIGLQVWIVIGCLLINALKKREELLLSIPMLVLVAGLWIGTPVYAEFRYAYPVFLTVTVILCGTLFGAGNAERKQIE